MKNMSLAFKISATFIILSAIIISFLYVVFYNLFEERMMQSEREKVILIAQTIEPTISINYFLNLPENINTLAANTLKNKLISSMDITIDNDKIWNSPVNDTTDQILVKFPIKDIMTLEIIGSININYDLANFHQSFKKIKFKIITYLLLLGLLFIAIAFYTRYLLKPLSYIAQKVQNYQIGTEIDFSSIRVEKETAAIVNAFEFMLLNIREHTVLLERYKQSVDESAIVAKIDLNTTISYVNDEFLRLSGYNRNELIGSKYNAIFHQDVRKNLYMELSSTLDSKQIWKGTIIHKHKDGTPFYVKTTIVPILDENQNLIEYISISSDITELEKTRKDIEIAAKVKGEFLANMSHEIRTPMNGILGFTKLLQDTNLDNKQQEYLDIIDGSTNSLLGIINDILDLSKLESGKFELDITQINPFIEFNRTASLFMAKAKEKNINFKAIIDPKITECISIDLLRIQQVVSNLISNAIKFTPIDGTITLYINYIESLDNKMKIRIGVKDSGIGIPKDKQQQIFEAFSQADSSTTRQFGGTGLGLSISAHLVSLMDGILDVESIEGLGSNFFFEIPIDTCKGKYSVEKLFQQLNLTILCESDKFTQEQEKIIQYLQILKISYTPLYNYSQSTILEKDSICILFCTKNIKIIDYLLSLEIKSIYICDYSKDIYNSEKLTVINDIQNNLSSLYNTLLNIGAKMSSDTTSIISSKDTQQKTYKGDVLVAEDNLVNQILIKEILSGYKLKPTIVSNGQEAVDKVLEEKFDLILMDINMPIMDGLTALKTLKKHNIKIPIVALTANAMAEDKEKFLKKGFNHYLSKPIVLDKLDEVLNRYLSTLVCDVEDKKISIDILENANDKLEKIPKYVDIQLIKEELHIPQKMITMLLKTYLDECQIQMKELQKSIDTLDFKAIEFAAHSIKGSSANLRIIDVEKLAKTIEDKAKQEKENNLVQSYQELVEIISKVEIEIYTFK